MNDARTLFSIEEEAELIPQLKAGQVILFVGAGFSINTPTLGAHPLPGGVELARRMNNILESYGEVYFPEKDLQNLQLVSQSFYRLHEDHPRAIDTFFRKNLTVDRTKIDRNYYHLKKVNWNGIYTTNYDDLLDAIYQEELLQKIAIKSVFKKDNSGLPNDNQFNIVYLNGSMDCNARIEKSNGRVVTDIICSITDFAGSNSPPIWNCFIEKIRQYPVIMVGSQLNEEHFYSWMSELWNKTNIDTRLRPKSYIINPSIEKAKFAEIERTYNIIHKEACTDDFLKWLASIFPEEQTGDQSEIGITAPLSSGYIEFTNTYWDGLRGKKTESELTKFYTQINSSPFFLPYVIADGHYVEPDEHILVRSIDSSSEWIKTQLKLILPKSVGYHNSLIKIQAGGGSGKSTLLFHIGRKYCDEFHILFFNDIASIKNLPVYPEDQRAVIVLVDNYGRSMDDLGGFSQLLTRQYFDRGFCLIVAERNLKSSLFDKLTVEEFEKNFSDVHNCKLLSNETFYEKLFDRVKNLTAIANELSQDQMESLKHDFIEQNKATVAEKIIELLTAVKHTIVNFQFQFDWEDWSDVCEKKTSLYHYSELYGLVAVFNYYNITPPVRYCVELLGINDSSLIKTYRLFANSDLPISISKDKCFELRNPNLAKWYLQQNDPSKIFRKKLFADIFNKPTTAETLYIFRNAYRNNDVLKDKSLAALLPRLDEVTRHFENFIALEPEHEDNSKNKMEMALISLMKKDTEGAKKILVKIIDDNPRDIHARTKLASLFIEKKHFDQAKPLVDFLWQVDPGNNYIIQLRISILKHYGSEISAIRELIAVVPDHAKANLKFLYGKLAKLLRLAGQFAEAVNCCQKLLTLNPNDYAAMNTLAMIRQAEGKFIEAEVLLITAIEIQPYNPHNYNELGQVYLQLYEQNREPQFKFKALHAFIRGLKIAPKNLPIRTEFARYLIAFCDRKTFAERILKENIVLNERHSYSYTELGKLYQKNRMLITSRDILLKGLTMMGNKENTELLPLYVVLGNSYFELGEYKKAEKSFLHSLALKQDNEASYLGLIKTYFKLQEFEKYQTALEEVLKSVTEIPLLCDTATWLRNQDQNADAIKLIVKAEQLNSTSSNPYINSIYAGLLIEKIADPLFFDEHEKLRLTGLCEKLCNATLKLDAIHEPSLHLLFKLNLTLREQTPKQNRFLRANYSKKYKNYLSQLFLTNRTSPYTFDGLADHLKTTRRYRLGIAIINKYGDFTKNLRNCLGQSAIFSGFLCDWEEVARLILTIGEKIKMPDIKIEETIKLITRDRVGVFFGDRIQSGDQSIPLYKRESSLKTELNINNRALYLAKTTKGGVKVFFGLYEVNGRLVANCIEPYFETLPDDSSIIKLLELE